jgi:hypothetical protein
LREAGSAGACLYGDIGQQRDPGEDRHPQGCLWLAVTREELAGGERADDGAEAGGRKAGHGAVLYLDGPDQQHDRRRDQERAEQGMNGEQQRAVRDHLHDPGVLIGGRDCDVKVQPHAQGELCH